MKKMRLRSVVLSFAILLVAAAAFGDDVPSILKEIAMREEIIEKELDSCEVYEKQYYAPGGYGVVVTYYKHGEIRKIRDQFDGDGATAIRECYYWDDKLFLVYRTVETFQLWPDQLLSDLGVTDEAYYYDKGQLVKWIIRTRKEMDPRDEDFKGIEEIVGIQTHNLLRFSESEYEDFDSFLEGEPSLIDWELLEGEGDIFSLPDEALSFLYRLEAHIESHDWTAVLDMAAQDHYETQVGELGMGHDQYIKELIGMYLGNDIAPDKDSDSEYPSCDRIRDVTFETWSREWRWLVIRGTIVDDAGDEVKLRIMLLSTFHGIYLTGAVG